MEITAAEKIRIIMKRRGITLAMLAQSTNQKASNLSNKMGRNNFTIEQLTELGDALGCDLSIAFIDRKTGELY